MTSLTPGICTTGETEVQFRTPITLMLEKVGEKLQAIDPDTQTIPTASTRRIR